MKGMGMLVVSLRGVAVKVSCRVAREKIYI